MGIRAFRSIRLRLTLWYVLLLAVILAAFSAGIYVTLRHNLYANLDDSLETRADDLLATVRFDGDRPTLAGAVSEEGQEEGEQFIRVFGPTGLVTFDTSPPAGAVAIDRGSVEKALAGEAHSRDASADGEGYRVRTVPIERDGRVGGVLEVGRSLDDVAQTLRTLLVILGIGYPVTLIVASFGGAFLAGRALSPIDRLTRLARQISAEDLGKRLDLQLPDDEVGRLARTFDEMIARFDDAFRP